MGTQQAPSPQPSALVAFASRHALAIIACVYLALALALSFALPLGEAADEVSHRAYVAELTLHHHPPAPTGPAAGESFHPPLYYMLVSALTAWIPGQNLAVQANPDFSLDHPDPPNLLLHPASESFPYSNSAWAWHLMRIVSVVFGAVAVWATYRLASEIYPGESAIAWGAAAFVAFLPGFLVVTSAVSNDSLIIALATLITWRWVRLLKQPPRSRDAVLLGVLLGLAAWTKATGFILWGVTALVFVWQMRDRAARQAWIRSGVSTFVLALCVVVPLLVYNLRLDGDILGWSRVYALYTRPAPMRLADWARYAASMYSSFWGRFGGASQIWLPTWVYAGLAVVPLLAVAGMLRPRPRERHTSRRERRLLVFLAALITVFLAAHIRFSMTILGADLARQVFPVLAPVAVLLTMGISRLTRRAATALVLFDASLAVFAVAFIAAVVSTFSVVPRDLAGLPQLGSPAPADFANQIRVVDYRIEQQPGAPTTELGVTIYWQALARPKDEDWLLFRLVGPQGVVATSEGTPSAGRLTTDLWRSGQVYISHHVMPVPPTVAGGAYRLEMGLHPIGRWQWLPVGGQDMLTLGKVEIQR